VTRYQEHPDEVRQQVIDLYLAGKKLSDIIMETGVSRPTVYWMLHQAGINPNRRGSSTAAAQAVRQEVGAEPPGELLDRLMAAERTIGQLQAENAMLRVQRDEQPRGDDDRSGRD
jgi:transposase-like protein